MMDFLLYILTISSCLIVTAVGSENLFASSQEGAGVPNLYQVLLEFLSMDTGLAPICSSILVLLICLGVGLWFKGSVERSLQTNDFMPSGQFRFRTAMEFVASFLDNLAEEQCGKYRHFFFPIFSSIFLFILVSNLTGLVPGLPPFSENFSANLAIGLFVFVCYNVVGVYEHRGAYIKQFTGPFLILAPIFILLECISHLARPLSLSFRLAANIFGDHLLLSIFSGLAPFLVPSFLMLFGLLVAVIQSFVFTMLTSIYVNMAISHDH